MDIAVPLDLRPAFTTSFTVAPVNRHFPTEGGNLTQECSTGLLLQSVRSVAQNYMHRFVQNASVCAAELLCLCDLATAGLPEARSPR
jgi:hypothetical protein